MWSILGIWWVGKDSRSERSMAGLVQASFAVVQLHTANSLLESPEQLRNRIKLASKPRQASCTQTIFSSHVSIYLSIYLSVYLSICPNITI